MLSSKSIYEWLNRHWVADALCMGILLVLLGPISASHWSSLLFLIFLQTPIYMLHQVEEHTGYRFRHFVNRQIFGGVEALNPASILWINIPGVWGTTILSLYAANFIGIGWGLAAVYFVLLNGLSHIIAGIATRIYNPGLWTSIILFLPVGGLALWRANSEGSIRSALLVGRGTALE